ncbi:MAG: hypothetical protein NC191_00810 [Muribaculaceae bacterium]|nr:hypothetical protein [Muribaculaceae bacterium]
MTESNFDNRKKKNDEFSTQKNSVKRKQTERKIRKKRKKVNRLKSVLRFLTLAALLFLSYEIFMLPQWYLPADTFKKPDGNTVEILNNQITPSGVMYDSLKDIKVSKLPIFLMRVKPIKKKLFLNHPIIKNIYVRRYGFPARIQIIVKERTPIAVIKTDMNAKAAAIFTSDGFLLSAKPYMILPNNSNILKILTNTANFKKDWSVKKVEEIEEIVKAIEKYSNEKVEYIDMRNPNDVYVKIKTTSLRLGTLDSSVFERIKRIHTILPQIKDVDTQIKYIDLSWDKVNYLKLNKNK